MAESKDPILGRTIAGKFRVMSHLGGGAMGVVYRAKQLALDKDVAIKILHGDHAGDATYAARFHREAKAASRLDHPNSMRVIDFGEEPDGLLYIAMEYLDGRDLFRVLQQEWPFPPARIADILSQALAAVAVAHEMGIVHRDLKPENIMLLHGTDDEGRARDVVKVCDFGIAKFTDRRDGGPPTAVQTLTTRGFVVGTPEYMSPEQGKGEALDARSDIYAMGVILYQLLTGRVPFEADSALGVVLKHVTEDPVAPRSVYAHADPRLEAICLKAMRKKREDRYQSAREMRTELRAAEAPSDPVALAATQRFHPVGDATAPMTPFDSSRVASARPAMTPSKLTPPGMSAPSGERSSRGRARLLAGLGLVVIALGAGSWFVRDKIGLKPVAPLAVAHGPVLPPAQTTLEPLPPPTPLVEPGSIPSGAAQPSSKGVASAPHQPGTAQAGAALEPSRARVQWSVSATGGGATPSAVYRALSRRAGAWSQCYRNGLERRAERIEGTGVLHVVTDESGNVVGAHVSGFEAMPGVKNCVANASHVKVDGVEDGDAWADVQLVFVAD